MAHEPQVEAEFHSESTVDGNNPPTDRFTGAFFPKAQNFVVAGAKFKSITNINRAKSTVPSDFRRIPIGDLYLGKEIRFDSESGTVNRWRGRHCVKRMYSARIHGSESPMTVALYQGENAEKAWCQSISRHSWLRHPNIVQLYATASSAGTHATVFHDGLILAKHLLENYRKSHFPLVHLWADLDRGFSDSELYVSSVVGLIVDWWDCTIWIRPSTGRVCVELAPSYDDYLTTLHGLSRSLNFPCSTTPPLLENAEDTKIIDSISLHQYHFICHYHLGRGDPILSDATVHLQAIISCSTGSDIGRLNEIALLPDLELDDSGWCVSSGSHRVVMESGWTRANSSDVGDGNLRRSIDFSDFPNGGWLAQAHHIFDRLGITSNHGDYKLVDSISYTLRVSDVGNIPPGYLFLCPLKDLQLDSPSHFGHPECPAYWSLDPSGAERLSKEEAEKLGFPHLQLTMKVIGYSWDETVYAGIRQFHASKGYDPDSQAVARELGYRLYQLSTELDGLCAHIQETEDRSEDSASGEHLRDTIRETSGAHCGRKSSWSLDQTEIFEPSRTWKIIIGAQLVLMVAMALF